MKIKIFYSNKDIESYENEINEFIKKKKIIDIKHSISSYAMANDYASSEGMDMSTLIMYEEMEEENANNRALTRLINEFEFEDLHNPEQTVIKDFKNEFIIVHFRKIYEQELEKI